MLVSRCFFHSRDRTSSVKSFKCNKRSKFSKINEVDLIELSCLCVKNFQFRCDLKIRVKTATSSLMWVAPWLSSGLIFLIFCPFNSLILFLLGSLIFYPFYSIAVSLFNSLFDYKVDFLVSYLVDSLVDSLIEVGCPGDISW